MKTKITVGIDNKPSEGLKKEWGQGTALKTERSGS